MSACPPGGSAARTPLNTSFDGGAARKLSGEPDSAGATAAPAENDPVLDGPDRQPSAPPALGPTDTVTV